MQLEDLILISVDDHVVEPPSLSARSTESRPSLRKQ